MADTELNSISSTLIWADQAFDRVPFFSTVTNAVDIFEKCAFRCCCSSKSINENRYISYIKNKSIFRCIVLLLPIIGNILVFIYDRTQRTQHQGKVAERDRIGGGGGGQQVTKKPEGPEEDLGIGASPTGAIEISIDDQRRRKLKWRIEIRETRKIIEKFRKIITDPNEPLSERALLEFPQHPNPHQAKINGAWSVLKKVYLDAETTLDSEEAQKEIVWQDGRQDSLSTLKNDVLQLRQDSYRKYIQTLNEEEVLREARKYYLDSAFDEEERQKFEKEIAEIKLKEFIPLLQERAARFVPLAAIEMREIIQRISDLKTEPATVSATVSMGISRDDQISEIGQMIERFTKIISNPDEPLEIHGILELVPYHSNPHQGKINHFWHFLKQTYFTTSSMLALSKDQNERISQQQQEISARQERLLQLRQDSYWKYIQTLQKEDLLKEARYYSVVISETLGQSLENNMAQMTSKELLPILEQQVSICDMRDIVKYVTIEIRQIIRLMKG